MNRQDNHDTLETIYHLARIGLSKEQITSYYGSLDSFWDTPEFTEMYVRGLTSYVINQAKRIDKIPDNISSVAELFEVL